MKTPLVTGQRMSVPEMPPLDSMALLLDIDGTLLDFAPAPDLVRVPPGLTETLLRLRSRLGGALGMITGRPIEQVDQFFPAVPTSIAGEHGAALRHELSGGTVRPELPAVPAHWYQSAGRMVASQPGALLERKANGFVVHYREAPSAGPDFQQKLTEMMSGQTDRFKLLPSNMAWEVKPYGVDKGTALRSIMCFPPFQGRVPVFIGDDVTDQDAIDAAQAMGGIGLLVPKVFGSPSNVISWLESLD